MVIRMTDSTKKQANQLRRTSGQKMKASSASSHHQPHNTKAEFKRLKTILPSLKAKENVSKLDIILEAIKYIDDLQDQLFDRLTGSQSQREQALLALTEQDMARSRARLNQLRQLSHFTSEKSSEDSSNPEDMSGEEDSDSNSLELL